MEPKELCDAGICVSMGEARRLSIQMKQSKKCRDKILKKLKAKRDSESEGGRIAETS